MVYKIAAKCDITKIKKMKSLGFKNVELYVRDGDLDAKYLPQEEGIAVSAVHVPNFIRHSGKVEYANIAAEGPVGSISYKMLEKTVLLARALSAGKIVLHPGYYNVFQSNLREAVSKLRKTISNLELCGITLCLENMPLWAGMMHSNEPIIFDESHMQIVKNELGDRIRFTLDIEHMIMSNIVKQFYLEFKECYRGKKDISILEDELQERLFRFTSDNSLSIKDGVDVLISNIIRGFRDDIIHIHVCGTDYLNHGKRTGENRIYQGEHLPLFFSGELDDLPVRDRINHEAWVSSCRELEHDIDVVIEIKHQKPFDRYEELNNNRLELQKMFEYEKN